MTDDLKTRLRWAADNSDGCGKWNCDPADLDAAADRIEALMKDKDAGAKDYCALMERRDALFVRAERLEAALRDLIDHTHNCEKELTEKLHGADVCGESLPLTNARAALKGAEHDG